MKIPGMSECHCMTLRKAARRVSQMYDDALSPTGLRVAQFSILGALHAGSPVSVNELADRLDLDRTTMGKNLRPLERDGLVTMEVAKTDRRSRLIALTAAGRKQLAAAYPLWRQAQERYEDANGRKKMLGLRGELGALQIDSREVRRGVA